jgi:hypothetical protein
MSNFSRRMRKHQEQLTTLRKQMGAREPESWGELQAVDFLVGKPYPLTVPHNQDVTLMIIDVDGFGLVFFRRWPDIASLEREPLELRCFVTSHNLYFLVRTGRMSWRVAAPYNPWRAAALGCELYEDPGPSRGMLFTICLVNSTTKILKACKVGEVSADFSRRVRVACEEILMRPIDDAAAEQEHARYTQMPIEVLAEHAKIRFSTESLTN